MVGKLGCGCCKCCASATSTWSESFATTPVADGNPFDVVRNISGPGCRSYPPATSTKSKLSQLYINADGSTPLYLGINGQRGTTAASMKMYWTDDTFSIADTPKMQRWQMVLPTSKTLANEMYVTIDSRLIPVFGGTQIELGVKVSYRKQVYLNPTTGNPVYQYRIDVQGYKKTGSGSPVNEGQFKTTEWGSSAYHVFGGIRWLLGLSLYETDCKSLSQARGFQIYYLPCNDLLDPGFCRLVPGYSLSYDNQQMDCYLGWKTDISWGVVNRSGGGTFSFGSHYVRWSSASWGLGY